jgi:hypothetical protein
MFWTPAFAGVTIQETFYEIIKIWCSRKKMSPPLAGGDEGEGNNLILHGSRLAIHHEEIIS